MPLARLLLCWLAALPLLACTSEPTITHADVFDYAAARRQCGPADGPAVSVYLAAAPIESLEPSPPYVRIDVWQTLEQIAGRSWNLTATSEEGGALYFRTATDHETVTSGHLTVTGVAEDNTITGSVDVVFPTAGRIRTEFSAPWIPSSMLCG